MNMATRVAATLAVTATLFPIASFGDGCFIWRNKNVDILQPEQKALIEWDGKTEKLTIETKYKGPADEMVWIVPVPSKPEIRRADLEALEQMSRITQDLWTRYTHFSTSKAAHAASPLLSRKKVGVYDVAVLAPNMSAAVVKWLGDNQFPVDDTTSRIIADYDARNWYIIAARIHPESLTQAVEGQLSEGTLHPLAISFETERCVYPMRMTALAVGPVEVLLWVKAQRHYVPETLSSPEWTISFHDGPSYLWDNHSSVWAPPVRDESRPTECITKLRRTFDPKRITEDLYLKEADYACFFDPADDNRVGMVATQWGLWRDARGIPLLVDYLSKTKVEDKPHVRSAIYALGECGVGGKLPAAAQELLLRVASDDDGDLGLECCVALQKAGGHGVGPIVLGRTEEVLDALATAGDSSQVYALVERRRCLADWCHSYLSGREKTQYVQLLRTQIKHLKKSLEDIPKHTPKLLDSHGVWLVEEAADMGDSSLVAPLSALRRVVTVGTSLLDAALASCGNAPAKDQLLRTMKGELGTLDDKFRTAEAHDIVMDNSSAGMFSYSSDRFENREHASVEVFGTTLEIAAKHLPESARGEMGAALLETSAGGDYSTLFLLGWLTHPEAAHVARLKSIWASATEEAGQIPARAILALKVAQMWKDAELIKWMLLQTTSLERKENCLAALLRTDPAAAAAALDNLVPLWNAKYSAMNTYGLSVHPESDYFRYQCHNVLRGLTSSALANDIFNEEYGKICSDKALHPATRYYLLDLGGCTSNRPTWWRQSAEALFDEVAAGVPQDDYRELVGLLWHSGCSKRLVSEWHAVQEDWKKEAVTHALSLTHEPETADLFGRMLTENWYERYKRVADGAYKDLIKTLEQSLRIGIWPPEEMDVVDRVVRDEKIDIGYRACIAGAVPVLSIPEMKEMLQKDLPEAIRGRLEFQIKQMELQQPREKPQTR